jgi:membrane protein
VKLIRFIAICLLVFVMLSLLLLLFGADFSFSTHRDLLITLLLLLCGYNLKVSQEDVDVYVGVYVIGGTLAALSFLVEYGFSVPEHYLTGVYKNQIGVLYGVLSLFSISQIATRRCPILFFICLIVLLWGMLVLRARTSLLVGVFLMLAFIVLLPEVSWKTKFLVALLVVGAFFCFADVLFNVFFAGKDVEDIDSISSSRVSRISDGIDFLRNDFFDGSLWEDKYPGKSVHVFVLDLLVRFGFVLALPVLVVYIYLFRVGLLHAFRMSIARSVLGVVPFCVLFLLITGLNEFSLPFSPASVTCLVYLALGLYLRALNSSSHAARPTHSQ